MKTGPTGPLATALLRGAISQNSSFALPYSLCVPCTFGCAHAQRTLPLNGGFERTTRTPPDYGPAIYGINGSPPCHSDYLQLFDGLEDSSLSLGKFCKLSVPPPITTSSEGARVIFVGTDSRRPASRKGVRISYRVTD